MTLHNGWFGESASKKHTKTGSGEGVRSSCHGIIKVVEITVAVLGDKVAVVGALGAKVAAGASLRKISMRSFDRDAMRGGG